MCKTEKITQGVCLTNQQKYNLYNEAVAFYELAECGRQNLPEQKHIESHIPYIVNMAFCAELLLKFLLIEEGKSIEYLKHKGHNLKQLYNRLHPQTKELIYHSFKRPLFYNIGDELSKSKNAFVQWRYLVLDKIEKANEESSTDKKQSTDNRVPFEKWLSLKSREQKRIYEKKNAQKGMSLFFLKDFNEVLISICKEHCK